MAKKSIKIRLNVNKSIPDNYNNNYERDDFLPCDTVEVIRCIPAIPRNHVFHPKDGGSRFYETLVFSTKIHSVT